MEEEAVLVVSEAAFLADEVAGSALVALEAALEALFAASEAALAPLDSAPLLADEEVAEPSLLVALEAALVALLVVFEAALAPLSLTALELLALEALLVAEEFPLAEAFDAELALVVLLVDALLPVDELSADESAFAALLPVDEPAPDPAADVTGVSSTSALASALLLIFRPAEMPRVNMKVAQAVIHRFLALYNR